MSDNISSEHVDIHFANKKRRYLPDEFFDDLAVVEVALDHGTWPEVPSYRGANGRSIPAIRAAVLEEIRKLLCTNDARYRAVRGQGKNISQAAVGVIAGYIANVFGLAIGFATGAVAFISLLIIKLGIGVFCALNPPPPVESGAGSDPSNVSPDEPRPRTTKRSTKRAIKPGEEDTSSR